MLKLLPSLPFLSQALPDSSQKAAPTSSLSYSHVTHGASKEWHLLGPAAEELLPELEKIYWNGVRRELAQMILTLRKWQQPDFSSVQLEDETDDFIHGYDTFVNQVCGNAREAAKVYETQRLRLQRGYQQDYLSTLKECAATAYNLRQSVALCVSLRKDLEATKSCDLTHQRARMLLQSAGFLDIDKVIEYRDTDIVATFWGRPVAPQLTLTGLNKAQMPALEGLKCSDCTKTIRSSSFRKSDMPAICVCETCYRSSHYGDTSFIKHFKHCVLQGSLTTDVAHKICRCTTVRHFDASGCRRVVFPVSPQDKHRGVGDKDAQMKCGLLGLGKTIADAKYDGMRSNFEGPETLAQAKRREEQEEQKLGESKTKKSQRRALQAAQESSLIDSSKRAPEVGHSASMEEVEVDDDIPFFLRKFTNKIPFGNVHMALRLGPLIIENGVEHTRGGALITSRAPPSLQVLKDQDHVLEYSLAISGDTSRKLWHQSRSQTTPKRYKAFMKQVVGGAFSGLSQADFEDCIIDKLVQESRRKFEKYPKQREAMLQQSVDRLEQMIRQLIGSRVGVYLDSVVSRLLDPSINLHWSFTSNTCQNFCDALIDRNLFGSLTAGHVCVDEKGGEPEPLYSMSFVCRPESYLKSIVKSKFDVPNGLTEEYLLAFRYGRHTESDIYDTLQEYWHDWGTFNQTLYPYQELFPWDCTEAFGRYPTKCGSCNLAKHIWAFPFDSWSLISLHLSKDRHMYPPADPSNPHPLTDEEWMHNRLTVLRAQDILLTGAAAMARNSRFRSATAWLHQQDDARQDRLKLGGIHRAQPFSHAYDKGKYHHYFVAEWAHLRFSDKVAAYELLRDGRAKMPDVPDNGVTSDNDDSGGCGGCGSGAACGGGCASGCAESGSGDGDGGGAGCGGDCGGCGGCGG